ncbi:hypothetical protein [Dactylosporangium darangshiense]|uniref:hypothetical protein n=1 Tax=Dactylosporangium darangshiense TaxID=579108 RepID=UPI0031E7859B
MEAAVLAMTWVALVLGAVCTVLGLVTVIRGRHLTLRLAVRADARRTGWFQLLLGSSILLNAVPRVAAAPNSVVLAFTVVALAPIGVAVAGFFRAQVRPRA